MGDQNKKCYRVAQEPPFQIYINNSSDAGSKSLRQEDSSHELKKEKAHEKRVNA
jgi:hypothetical protein